MGKSGESASSLFEILVSRAKTFSSEAEVFISETNASGSEAKGFSSEVVGKEAGLGVDAGSLSRNHPRTC